MPRKKQMEKSRRLLTSLTYDYKLMKGESNSEPSMTIPDETISVKEMLYRFTNGIPLPPVNNYEFIENYDDVPPHLKPNFDLTDLDELRNEYEYLKDKQKWETTQPEQQSAEQADSSDRSSADSLQTPNSEERTTNN